MGSNSSKSLFCLTCFDEKKDSIIHSSTLPPMKLPCKEYEIESFYSLNASYFRENHKTISYHAHKEEEKIANNDSFLSFKNINDDEQNKAKTNSFFSFTSPDRSIVKSMMSSEEKLKNSNFMMKSSQFRCGFLLENIFKLISSTYDGFDLIYNDTKSDMKLKIYLKSYIKGKSRINIFRTEYLAPCSAKEYLNFANNIEVQKALDTTSENYYIVKKISEKTDILYLSYKKTIITSPRDFLYLKTHGEYTFNNQNYYCIVGKSIELEEFQVIEDTIRCEIINSGYVIEGLNQGNSLIKTYSEFDFKINIPLFLVKNFSISESRKFVENSIAKLKEILKK